jgi:hypothetical protein
LLQWQPFAAILEWSRCEVSPRYVARLIPNNVRGFSLSSNPSLYAAGVQAPATLRLTGRTRLADDSTAPPRYPHSPITQRAKRIPGSFLFQQYNEKGRRILPLRPRSGACCH